MKQQAEIMSPVGSYESLMAAVKGGADSVYFGVGKLNMRSRSSKKFNLDDLVKIVDICKSNNVKSYLTLNTIIYDNEIDEMKTLVDKAKDSHISAIIASDLSVMQYCRENNVNVHASTQCNITNLQAVKFYSKFADVMVLARELSLQQVNKIVKGIEDEKITGPSGELVKIEIFVHGALCMAISGKCYLSLDNMNYSANRGACLQLCRRSYIVTDKEEGFELEVDHEYIMSPKDLCTINFLDKIINAGVKVLKIEGRGRGPEYVKIVTECYKEAVNAISKGNYSKENIEKWEKRLSSVFNRGFWDGYYLGRKMGEWSERYGSQATHKKIYVGKVTNFFSNIMVAEIKMESNVLETGNDIFITGPTTGVVNQNVDEIRLELKPVNKTVKGDLCSIKTKELVRRGDKVYKIIQQKEEF
ncbi:MAG: peptidase U32 family protein [Bacteroidota bacterium]